jgi:hypothetical protein
MDLEKKISKLQIEQSSQVSAEMASVGSGVSVAVVSYPSETRRKSWVAPRVDSLGRMDEMTLIDNSSPPIFP